MTFTRIGARSIRFLLRARCCHDESVSNGERDENLALESLRTVEVKVEEDIETRR